MSYTLQVQVSSRINVRETVDDDTSPLSVEGGNQRTYSEPGLDVTLSADTEPAVAGEVVDLSWTLAGSSKDFDLTAAPCARDSSETVDKSTAKLVAIQIQMSKDNNAGGVTFGPQGGNGYALFGASKTVILYPGANLNLVYADPDGEDVTLATPTVGGSAKDLRFAGTAADSWTAKLIFNG
jgi:hypothetical protein